MALPAVVGLCCIAPAEVRFALLVATTTGSQVLLFSPVAILAIIIALRISCLAIPAVFGLKGIAPAHVALAFFRFTACASQILLVATNIPFTIGMEGVSAGLTPCSLAVLIVSTVTIKFTFAAGAGKPSEWENAEGLFALVIASAAACSLALSPVALLSVQVYLILACLCRDRTWPLIIGWQKSISVCVWMGVLGIVTLCIANSIVAMSASAHA